jgi:acyl-CoA synthetase (AMP-forming)/AMP-acid ligase II
MPPFAFLQKPVRWLKAISHYRATTSGGPNFAYDLCVRKVTPEQQARLDLSSWEVAFNGAEPVRAETLERFTACFQPQGFRPEAFYPCYGMAEATLMITGGLQAQLPTVLWVEATALEQNQIQSAPEPAPTARPIVGCGQPWGRQAVAIVDPEALKPSPPGQVGEIWVAGPSVTQGYWAQPELSQQTFHGYLPNGEGPFLRTGDLGFMQDGELFITGRLKDLLIIRGRNHYPQDLELTTQKSHPALQAGMGAAFVVAAQPDEKLVITHEVDRNHQRHLEPETVIADIRQALLEYHELAAHQIVLVKYGSLPKTSSGKIRRRACQEAFLTGNLEVIYQV